MSAKRIETPLFNVSLSWLKEGKDFLDKYVFVISIKFMNTYNLEQTYTLHFPINYVAY